MPGLKSSISINREGTVEEKISEAVISKLTKSNSPGKKSVKGKKPLPKVEDIIKKNGK
tara:strand:- start:3005 stop:3178 length:174 start_codon:yes stop_codon:yes gene_type:complete